MSTEAETWFEGRFFRAACLLAAGCGLLALVWLFRGAAWSLLLFSGAWVLVVTAFAWEILTRAERLNRIVHSRTDLLEEHNRYLDGLLEQSNVFRAVSYEINQKNELEQIAEAFTGRLHRSFSAVDSVWLWLDGRLTAPEQREEPSADERGPLELVSQLGAGLGSPAALKRLRRDDPLVERCFQDCSVAVEHELARKGVEWGRPWLAGAKMESFAAFRLQLGPTIVGVLGVFSRGTLTAEFVRQLSLSVNQLAVALTKARLLKETRRRADELLAAYEALKKLDAMKDWFITSVSHELRTPLTAIRSFSEILETYEDLSAEERREFAATIREESERLSLLIDDVLDLQRMERGVTELRPRRFDLVDVVRSCCRLFAREAKQRGMQFRQVLPDKAPAYADDAAVARVLNNLIGNAFKFTPDGGAVEVIVQPPRPGEGRTVTTLVRDTGRGVAPEDQSVIFERFTQVGTTLTDKPPGSGIGLAICKELVEKSSGRIWVESARGQGSTFSFTLPAARTGADTHQQPAPAPQRQPV